MKEIKEKRLVNIIPPLVLFVVWFIIVIQNYSPGTWLTGWDNLHPEFDLLLNIRRSLSVAWQEYQGLGLLGGMAHAADLPRQLILLLFSVLVPTNLLRYTWTFLMLLIGPLGAYYLAKNVLLRGIVKKNDAFTRNIASLVVGLFYLFNLATVQYFFVPFETFISFYGFLPWLIYFALKYFLRGERKDAIWLFLFSIIATPVFYVHTLFIVYLIVLGVVLAGHWLATRKINPKRILVIGLVIFIANAFWLLPASVFTFKNPGVAKNSKINSIATVETQLMNKATGNIKDISLLKGFWFEYVNTADDGEFDYLMPEWREHIDSGVVRASSYVLFAMSILGFITALKKKKYVWRFSGIGLFVLASLMLTNSNPPLGFVFDMFGKLPLMGQAFRSVFTKWSVVSALVYAWGLGLFVVMVAGSAKKLKKGVLVGLLIILTVLMIVVIKPIFNGGLIDSQSRTNIPQIYLDLFKYFYSEPKEGRIFYMPADTFWGWNIHSWGYGGSGFLWYGIEQPILDRAFDVWSQYNETFYHEASTAVYGGDSEALGEVLKKYNVTYILLDESIIASEQDGEILRIPETKQMLSEIGAKVVFQDDFLSVYKLPNTQESFVYAPDEYIALQNETVYGRRDVNFKGIDYVSVSGSRLYPFSDIFSEKISGISYEDRNEGVDIVIERNVEIVDGELVIPPFEVGNKYDVPVHVKYFDTTVLVIFEPNRVAVGDNEYEIGAIPALALDTDKVYESVLVSVGDEIFRINQGESVSKVSEFTVGDSIDVQIFSANGEQIDVAKQFLSQEVEQCWTREDKHGAISDNVNGDVRSFSVIDAAACVPVNIGSFSKPVILSVTLPFRSTLSDSRPHYCVLRTGEDEDCENSDVFNSSVTSTDWTEVTREMVLAPDKYWMVVGVRSSDIEGETWGIEYKSPVISSHPLIANSSFDSSVVWKDILEEKRLSVDAAESVILKIASKKNDINLKAVLGRELENCDLFERGTVDKLPISNSQFSNVIKYSADDRGAICDYFVVSEMNTDQAYILRFTGEGLSGRGTKLYLYNQSSKRNDLETLLPDEEFDESFAVLNWPQLDKDNYTLNLETRSFGGLSENRIDSISYHSVPLDWLASIRFEAQSSGFRDLVVSEDLEDIVVNNVRINHVNKVGAYKYKFDAVGDGLIVLSQGYENGWIAYEGKGILSPLFGNRLVHQRVNGWANGFIVDECEDGCSITIVYWPQYLQFAGFVLLVAGTVWAIRLYRHKD